MLRFVVTLREYTKQELETLALALDLRNFGRQHVHMLYMLA